MDVDTGWWLLWVFIGFLPFEVYAALTQKKGDTLSENVWDWFGVRRQCPYGRTRRFLLSLFMSTLSLHFVFGKPGGLGVIITGAPVGLIVLWSIFVEGRIMSKDQVKAPGLIAWMKLGLLLKRFLMKTHTSINAWFAAVGAAFTTASVQYALANTDLMITGGEWGGIAIQFISVLLGTVARFDAPKPKE